MGPITVNDWSFDEISREDRDRAKKLKLGSPDELVQVLIDSLICAIDCGDLRLAVDSRHNAFTEIRAIVQFWVARDRYDWFFNGITGYRAHFWIGPKVGAAFNRRIVDSLAAVLSIRLPETVTVRRIEVDWANGSRDDRDVGEMVISSKQLIKSLTPDASKIWIGERLYSIDGGPIEPIHLSVLRGAEDDPKLCIPQWEKAVAPKSGEVGEGLRAPFPLLEYSWLDLKGGFLDAAGNSSQEKNQDTRACDIHTRGWT